MRFAFPVILAAALPGLPLLAHATPLVQFEITGYDHDGSPGSPPGPLDLTFTLPAMPTDVYVLGPGEFFYRGDIAVTRNGVETIADGAEFYGPLFDGGLTLAEGEQPGYDFWGDQLYRGSPSAPVFLPGTYTLHGYGAEKLVISRVGTTAAPEPGSFALLGTGTLAVFGSVRRRLRRW